MSDPAPSFTSLVNQRLRRRNTRILLASFTFVAAVVGVEALIFQAATASSPAPSAVSTPWWFC